MTRTEIESASREELADELAAACEFTGDWLTAELSDLRDRVCRLLDEETKYDP